MPKQARKYATAYKKHVDVERDVYLPRRTPKGLLWCTDCGATYYRRRWTLTPPEEVRTQVESMTGLSFVLCPACRKIRDQYPSGELQVLGVGAEGKEELFRLLKNQEEKARKKNPLERIMAIRLEGPAWKIDTTTEKFAQHLGRALKKARGGRVTYKWSHNNKFVRVIWEKQNLKKAA
jgi:NMD protein affecting ribosome stability and mRNA decay